MIGPLRRALSIARRIRDRLQYNLIHHPFMDVTNCYTTPSTFAEAQLSSHTARRRLHVNSLRDRFSTTEWMVAHALVSGDEHIASKCVAHLP